MRPRNNARAYIVSFEVFVVLLAITYYEWEYLDLANVDQLYTYFVGVVALSIALVVMNVFQSLRVHQDAKNMAQDMAVGALIDSRELFTELYRGSPVPYLTLDHHGVITSTNLAALRLFHINEGELDGKRMVDYLEEEEGNVVSLLPSRVAQGLTVSDEEVMIVRPNGGTRWVLLSLFSYKDRRKKQNGLLTLVDITKQKEIDRAKSEFVSLASHQLRTPISSMKWNLELLMVKHAEGLTEKQREYVKKVDQSAERMDALVSDFLNVSKLELGTLSIEEGAFSLPQFYEMVMGEHVGKAEDRSITIQTEFDTSISSYPRGEHLLRMIAGNLLSNAIKYSQEGGKVILRTLVSGNKYHIIVADSGMGIPLDEQDQIFSKIFRASNAKNQVPDGTGLGLYIVREAARVLGGDITFVSEENVGTTFTVELPLR